LFEKISTSSKTCFLHKNVLDGESFVQMIFGERRYQIHMGKR